jgi:hypothetical protein
MSYGEFSTQSVRRIRKSAELRMKFSNKYRVASPLTVIFIGKGNNVFREFDKLSGIFHSYILSGYLI